MRTINCKRYKKSGISKDGRKVLERERRFHCDLCSNSFFLKQTLKNHKRNIHTDEKPYICEFCGKAFKVDYYRIQHLRRIHLNEKDHKCELCGKEFHTRTSLKQHVRVHHNSISKARQTCPDCGKIFAGEERLSAHIKVVHKLEGFPCSFPNCAKIFLDKCSITLHVKTVHSDNRPFPCSQCALAFKRKDTLAKHKLRFHTENNRSYFCTTCGASFLTNDSLQIHKRTHNSHGEYKCRQCPVKYRQRVSLVNHVTEVHQGVKSPRIPCTIPGCGATSKNNYTLSMHKKIVHGGKSVKCYFCPLIMLSINSDQMKNHLRTHTREKPFPCAACAKSFRAPHSLRNHQTKHHSQGQSNLRKIKHNCPICQKEFSSKSYIQSHITHVHRKERNHPCTLCGQRFAYRPSLHNHIAVVHTGEKHFRCKYRNCNVSCATRITLAYHILRTHGGKRFPKCYFCGKQFVCRLKLSEHMGVHTEENGIKCDICNDFVAKSHYGLKRHKTKSHFETRFKTNRF